MKSVYARGDALLDEVNNESLKVWVENFGIQELVRVVTRQENID